MKSKTISLIFVFASFSSFASFATDNKESIYVLKDLDRLQSSILYTKAKNDELALIAEQHKLRGGDNRTSSSSVGGAEFSSPVSDSAVSLVEVYGTAGKLTAVINVAGKASSYSKGDVLPDGSQINSISLRWVGLRSQNGKYYRISR